MKNAKKIEESVKKTKTPFSLLIKPAGADCNLRCKYCFYIDHLENKNDRPRMSEEVLKKLIVSYMGTPQPQYSFGWQGGEPTLMGLDFFKKVVEFQRLYGQRRRVTNGLQTNGTLITDEMAAFFAKYKFLLGVSLDGPEHLHDHFRKNMGGKPTHSAVIRGIEHLKNNKVEFNILTLVNSKNVKHVSEIYQYFVDKGFFYLQYIPCVEFNDKGELEPYSVTGEQWGYFLCEIFDIWIERDTDLVSVRLFESIMAYLIDKQHIVCYMDNNCCQYFVVEHNGDIFPCDFHVDEELKLGNIETGGWDEFFESNVYQDFGKKKAIWNKKCNSCQFLEFCHGDCLKMRTGGFKSPTTESHLCEGWIKFYSHALPKLKELAKRFEKRREIVSSPSSSKIGRNVQCPCGSGKKFKNCCLKFVRLKKEIPT